MEQSTMWWLGMGALLILELLSGTFYLLMLSLGLAAAALCAHAGGSFGAQLAVASVVGAGAALAWYLVRRRQPAASGDNLNLDLGHEVRIEAWGPQNEARIRYRGADWVAVLKPGSRAAADGRYRVFAIEGSRLVIEPLPPT